MTGQTLPAPQPGSRYQLLSKLGTGGMGVVYTARDRLTGQTVALKCVTAGGDQLDFASQTTEQDFRLSLAQEFRILAGLRHPHIINVLDYSFDMGGQPYYTMSLVDQAQTVIDYALELDLPGKVRVLSEILLALGYLHRRGIIHRDLKPANVLVNPDGVVKVMDFGLALHQAEALTASQEVGMVGTMAYMAPELFQEGSASIQSDLYAFGLIAYELFTGKFPFAGKNVVLLANSIINEQPSTQMLDFPLASVLNRLLAKSPNDRYESADEVLEALCRATGQPMPQENTLLRESYLQAAKFVGRNAELHQLLTSLNTAVHGEGAGWLIGGESGVGKSRLLDEVRTHALVAGALVLRGQTVASGGSPYQLWRDVLRRLILAVDVSDSEASILKITVPDIATLLERAVPEAPQQNGKETLDRLSETITALFKRLNQPVVLMLEDLHWANESLELLKALAQLAGESAWLIVGTYRHDEMPDLPEKLPGMHTLMLERFTEATITELSVAMLGDAGRQPEIIHLLQHETEGNAFFVVEVMRALAENAGRLSKIGNMPLPDTVNTSGVAEVVRRRLNRLPEIVQAWLKLVAIIGRQLDLDVLQVATRLHNEVTEAAADSEIMPAVKDELLILCASAHVLEVYDGNWRFAHDKIRETLLADLPPAESKFLHRIAAEALETVYPDNELYADALCEHWYTAGNTEKTVAYTIQAIYRLNNITAAYSRAQTLLERALGLVEVGQDYATMRNLLGDVLMRMALFDEGEEQYRIVLDIPDLDEKSYIAAYNGLSWICFVKMDDKPAIQYAKEAESRARAIHNDYELARSLYYQSAILCNAGERDYPLALSLGREALAIRQRLGNLNEVASSISGLGWLAVEMHDYEQAEIYLKEALAIRRSLGTRASTARSLTQLAMLHYRRGQFDAAKTLYEEALTLFRAIDEKYSAQDCLSALGMIALAGRQYDTAQMYFDEMTWVAQEIDDDYSVASAKWLSGLVNYALGDYEEALANYAEALIDLRQYIESNEEVLHIFTHQAFAQLAAGQTAEARATLYEALQIVPATLFNEIRSLQMLAAALWYLQTGNPVRAAQLTGLASIPHPEHNLPDWSLHFAPLMNDLKAALDAGTLAKALDTGRKLDMESTVAEILSEFAPKVDDNS